MAVMADTAGLSRASPTMRATQPSADATGITRVVFTPEQSHQKRQHRFVHSYRCPQLLVIGVGYLSWLLCRTQAFCRGRLEMGFWGYLRDKFRAIGFLVGDFLCCFALQSCSVLFFRSNVRCYETSGARSYEIAGRHPDTSDSGD